MTHDDVLVRVCPVCDALYGEHSLEGLAACMEEAFDAPVTLLTPPRKRRIEIVRSDLV